MNTPARVRCECGVEILSTEVDDLVTQARLHALRHHQMDVPIQRILAMVEPPEATFTPPSTERRDGADDGTAEETKEIQT